MLLFVISLIIISQKLMGYSSFFILKVSFSTSSCMDLFMLSICSFGDFGRIFGLFCFIRVQEMIGCSSFLRMLCSCVSIWIYPYEHSNSSDIISTQAKSHSFIFSILSEFSPSNLTILLYNGSSLLSIVSSIPIYITLFVLSIYSIIYGPSTIKQSKLPLTFPTSVFS